MGESPSPDFSTDRLERSLREPDSDPWNPLKMAAQDGIVGGVVGLLIGVPVAVLATGVLGIGAAASGTALALGLAVPTAAGAIYGLCGAATGQKAEPWQWDTYTAPPKYNPWVGPGA